MIYFYDGSCEAFLTAFVLSYGDEEAVLTSCSTQLSLGQESVFVCADAARAERAAERLLSFDKRCLKDLDTLLLSGDKNRDAVAFDYMRFLAQKKAPVRGMFAEPCVTAAVECMRRVETEIHRMHGFLRFMETASGALYAPVSPDNDIILRLVPHFRARLGEYPFVIHDVGRRKAVLCNGKSVCTAPLERAEFVVSANEADFRSLWKRYYESVNIPARERLKQMRGYLPVRYRKFMTEFE